jgi:hypothetical protein
MESADRTRVLSILSPIYGAEAITKFVAFFEQAEIEQESEWKRLSCFQSMTRFIEKNNITGSDKTFLEDLVSSFELGDLDMIVEH